MTNLRPIAAALALTTMAALPAHAATLFDIQLDSAQEVGSAGALNTTATGAGTASITRDADGLELRYDLTFDAAFDFAPILGNPAFPFTLPAGGIGDTSSPTGLEVTRLHIHNAPRGANGGVVYGILNPGTEQDFDAVVSQVTGGGFRVTGGWDIDEGAGGASFADFLPSLLSLQTGDDSDLYFNLHTGGDPAGAVRGQLVAANDLSVAPVPVPASALLLGGGLVLLGTWGRRRKAG